MTTKDPHSAGLNAFQALLDAWAGAIVSNDADQIQGFTEPDWQLIDPAAGLIPLARFLDVVRGGSLIHSAMTLTVHSVKQIRADVAVVVVHGTNTGTWHGTPFSAREWTTDVFVRNKDRWRCQLTAITPDRS